jgi:hypothetical protein
MDSLGKFLADAIRAAARIDEVGGPLIELAARHMSADEATKVRLAVFEARAVLAHAHTDCPLGRLEAIEERLTAAEEQSK